MNNLLTRNEYLEMNEGFKDTIRMGFNKLKSFFKLGIKKVKNLILAFDSTGKILPVVTPHALIDHFANVDGANAFTSKDLNAEIAIAGGNEVSSEAHYDGDNEIYSYCPKFKSRKEMVDWFKNKEYEKSSEYKNFTSLLNTTNESINSNNNEEINEDLEKVYKERKTYTDDTDIEGIKQINYEQFKKLLVTRLKSYSSNSKFKPGNMLVFGAPGIGKSTIPKSICDAWNANENNIGRVSLITVDTQTIQPGDLMMPEIPNGKSILDNIKNQNEDEYKALMKNTSLSQKLSSIYQNKSKFMAPSWLPVYMKTNDPEVDEYLNNRANGGVYDADGNVIKEGNGGFLFFDELLRADPMIFHQTMNLFTKSRTINGWTLGSKWALIACTNRPADSERVKDVWRELVGDGALADRFPYKFFLLPDPESWKKWAKEDLFADDMILDYIFEENSATAEGEYPRWHTFSPVDADDKLVNSVSPRKWEEAIIALNTEMEMNDYSSIGEMSKTEIMDCISGLFDEEFVDDFSTWIEDHAGNITIDQIIEAPTKVKPRRSAKTDDIVIIRDIHSQIENAHKDGRNFTDDEMKNIMLWLCINFPTMGNEIETDFIQYFDKLVETDKVLETYRETLQIYNSAYPSKEVLEMMKEDEEFAKYLDYDKMKELCSKYFPNNLKDGEIIPYNEYSDEK